MDTEEGKAQSTDWRVAAISSRGANHRAVDLPCQDSNHWRSPVPGLLVAAIADGAGSVKLADVGADIASRVAVEHACRQLPPRRHQTSNSMNLVLRESVIAARIALELEARNRQAQLGDLACTLILLIASQDSLAVAQIGDGAVVVQTKDGSLETLTIPARGEYFNETRFVTSSDALDLINFVLWVSPITHIAAFTDGIEMLALEMPNYVPYRPFFSPLFRMISAAVNQNEANHRLRTLLSSSEVEEKTDDDITILLATQISS